MKKLTFSLWCTSDELFNLSSVAAEHETVRRTSFILYEVHESTRNRKPKYLYTVIIHLN